MKLHAWLPAGGMTICLFQPIPTPMTINLNILSSRLDKYILLQICMINWISCKLSIKISSYCFDTSWEFIYTLFLTNPQMQLFLHRKGCGLQTAYNSLHFSKAALQILLPAVHFTRMQIPGFLIIPLPQTWEWETMLINGTLGEYHTHTHTHRCCNAEQLYYPSENLGKLILL